MRNLGFRTFASIAKAIQLIRLFVMWCRRYVKPSLGGGMMFLVLGASFSNAALAGMVSSSAIQVMGDFNGDGELDRARGFAEASDGAGRVDIHWGQNDAVPTRPTAISPIVPSSSSSFTLRSYGFALAAGDFDGDGIDDLAVGAPKSSDKGHHSGGGSVQIMYGCKTTCGSIDADGSGVVANMSALNPEDKSTELFTEPSPTWNDRPHLGFALASGDFNNDDWDDLAIARPYDGFSGKREAGQVLVHYGSVKGLDPDASVELHQGIMGSDYTPESYDHFGLTLASANLDGRNGDDLVVGAPDESWGSYSRAGEVSIFWGGTGTPGLSALSNERIRLSSSWTGASRANQRYGYELNAEDGRPSAGRFVNGVLEGGIEEVVDRLNCGVAIVTLRIDSGKDVSFESLNCGRDFCEIGNAASHGQLPATSINYVVVAQPDTEGGTVAPASISRLPNTWSGAHPITGEKGNGAATYFKAMTDLINQQMVSSDGGPICYGNDCVRFEYASHQNVSSIAEACPELAALVDPTLQYTGNCSGGTDYNLCPNSPFPPNEQVDNFSTYAYQAAMVCIDRGVLPYDKFNILVYDECRRTVGSDNVFGTENDDVNCDIRNGRARSGLKNSDAERILHNVEIISAREKITKKNHPIAYIDWQRALHPRVAGGEISDVNIAAAEEHEVGHAFGLHHRVLCLSSLSVPTMSSGNVISKMNKMENGGVRVHPAQTAGCLRGDLVRQEGFSNYDGYDFFDHPIIEVEELVKTARKHHEELWSCH